MSIRIHADVCMGMLHVQLHTCTCTRLRTPSSYTCLARASLQRMHFYYSEVPEPRCLESRFCKTQTMRYKYTGRTQVSIVSIG